LRERATPADLLYAYSPDELDPWVAGLELDLERDVGEANVRRALEEALTLHPRCGAYLKGKQWRRRQPSDAYAMLPLGDDEDWDDLRPALLDTWFDPEGDPGLRVAYEDGHLFLAWAHGVTDVAGAVGFVSSLMHALAGNAVFSPAQGATATDLQKSLRTQMLRPSVLWEFARRVRGSSAKAAGFPWPLTSAVAAASDAAVWVLDNAEFAKILARAAQENGSFTGALTAALAGMCVDRCAPGETATVYIPLNLRPSHAQWWPLGNWVGSVEILCEGPVTIAQVQARLTRALEGHNRYAPLLTNLVRSKLPRRARTQLATRRSPDLSTPPARTICLNNLGKVPKEMLPEVERAVFHAPTGVKSPTLSVLSVGDVTTFNMRVRRHQGGLALARELMEELKTRVL